MQKHKQTGGFTLIELMIVVAIIGILAAIAIPAFAKFQMKSKTAEGKVNLAAIRTAEESVFAEYGTYVAASPSPDAILNNVKTPFINEDGANAGFDQVGWSPEGPVYFNYSVEISVSGSDFTAAAVADIDDDGTVQTWGYTTDTALDAADHVTAGGQCDQAGLVVKQVGPCDAASGSSVF